MAINLKKESGIDNTDNDTVKTVSAEQDPEEFYQRQIFPENYGAPEIYPRKKTSAENYYPKQAFPENYDVSEIYPAQSVQSENTAVLYKSSDKSVSENPRRGADAYPAAPPKKTEISNVLAAAIIVFVSVITVIVSLKIIAAETSIHVQKPESVNNYTYTVKEVTEPVSVHPDVTDPEEPDYSYLYDTAEYSADEVDALVIEGSFSRINVSKNYGSSISVNSYKSDDCTFDINNKILTVSCKDRYGDAFISLPAIYKGSVTINVNAYELSESDIDCTVGKDINITAESGKVRFSGLSGSSASVSIDSGSIEFNDCELNSCDLYAGNGNISIWNSSVLEKSTARTNGVIDIYSSVFFSEFEAYGQIGLKKTVFDRKVSLTAADGYIKGENIDFEDIYIKARNSTVNISTNASSDKYTAVLNSDEDSTVRYEPSAPSGQGSNRIKLDLTDSEAYFTFGD